MDVQSAPPTYTPTGARPLAGNPPVLGQQVPGMSGGLPALSGLSVMNNPMAKELQSQGRQGDSTLVHMSPDEVSGLQALALSQGTSMTINPVTGLPEAFKLGKIFKALLPTLIGVGMNFILPGSGLVAQLGGKAVTAGLMTGLGSFALTGSLKKGLMAGLGAFGGASLAGGIQGALAKAPVTPGSYVTPTAPVGGGYAPSLVNIPAVPPPGVPVIPPTAASVTSGVGANAVQTVPSSAFGRFAQGFAQTAKGPMTGLAAKAAVPLAIAGSMQGLNAFSPGVKTPGGQIDNSYTGPYTPQVRPASYRSESPITSRDSSENLYFANSMPEIYDMQGHIVQPGTSTARGTPIFQPVLNSKAKKGQNMYDWQYVPYMGAQQQPTLNQPLSLQDAIGQRYPSYNPNNISGYNAGGEVHLKPGGFVVDARSVSEGGNGFTLKGQEELAKLGGIPLNGPGDGVSDSIKARIGNQPARVAAGEVYMPPEAVKRIGKGDEKRGAQKLYAMMDRAHQATKRGQKRDILKGLA